MRTAAVHDGIRLPEQGGSSLPAEAVCEQRRFRQRENRANRSAEPGCLPFLARVKAAVMPREQTKAIYAVQQQRPKTELAESLQSQLQAIQFVCHKTPYVAWIEAVQSSLPVFRWTPSAGCEWIARLPASPLIRQ